MIVKLNVKNFTFGPDREVTRGDESDIRQVVIDLMKRDFDTQTLKMSVDHRGKTDEVEAVFKDPLEAAVFLAGLSPDRARAALFRTFWGDGE